MLLNFTTITLSQIIILSLYSGLSKIDDLSFNIGFNQILISAIFTGLLLNKLEIAILIGIIMQGFALGVNSFNGISTFNFSQATMITIAMSDSSSEILPLIMLVGLPVGFISQKLDFYNRMSNALIVKKIDNLVLENKVLDIKKYNLLGLLIWFLFNSLSTFLCLILIPTKLINAISIVLAKYEFLNTGLKMAANILPAITLALILKYLKVKDNLLYVAIGFVCVAYFNLSLLTLILIGAIICIHIFYENYMIEDHNTIKEFQHNCRYSVKQLKKFHHSHIINLEASWNYQRIQGLGYLASISPILHDSYKDNQLLLEKSLRVHAQYYDTNPIMSDIIFGMNVALEENSHSEDVIERSALLKIRFMDEFKEIGNIVFKIMMPLLLGSLAISFINKNNYHLIAFLPLYGLVNLIVLRPYLFKLGHSYGDGFLNIMQSKIDVLIKSLKTFVLIIIGGLIFYLVRVNIMYTFNLIPLLLVCLYYYLLSNKYFSVRQLIFITIFICLIFALIV